MVKENVTLHATPPSVNTSYGEKASNNSIPVNSVKPTRLSEEYANKELATEHKWRESSVDSFDLMALDVKAEHNLQLDGFNKKICDLTEEIGLLRQENERLKATTGGQITHNYCPYISLTLA